MMRRATSSVLTILCLCGLARATQSRAAGMLRYPDVSARQIVFVYADDLWLVPRSGGVATPLASPEGAERSPKFDASGETIAFVGNYEGNTDLYTVPVAGGLPTRVTHHPSGEMLSDWSTDGRLIFSSSGLAGIGRAPQMFSVPATGGLPSALPIPYGQNGSLNADGRWLAYTPNARDNRNWKRYRGGMASDVWLFDLESRESQRVTDWEGTDSIPMWHGDTLYYLSDRGPAHRLNIWRFERATAKHTQVTQLREYDVKWPSIGPGERGQGEIVFQNGSGLFLLDLASEEVRSITVQVPGVRETLLPESVDVSSFVRGADISPTGKRVVVEARGDVWTLPAKEGTPRNLTRSDGIAERSPSWSPDGRWVAYFSDASGEYELCITQSDGRGETRQLTTASEGYRYGPTWSPDSKQIAFSDRSGSIYVHDIAGGATKYVDRDEAAEWGVELHWSHDSRWLTWAAVGPLAATSSILLYDNESSELHKVTSDMFSDQSPVFDRQGDYLYFVSARDFKGLVGSSIDSNYIHRDTDVLLAVPLRASLENPWTPKSDEESWEEPDEERESAPAPDGEEPEAEPAEGESHEDGDESPSDEGAPAATGDGVSGSWSGSLTIPGMGVLSFDMTLTLEADGSLSGDMEVSGLGHASIAGSLDRASSEAQGTITGDDGQTHGFHGTLAGGSLSWSVETENGEAHMSGSLGSDEGGSTDAEGEGASKTKSKKAKEPAARVEIDLEGFERRAFALPVSSGSFRNLEVNDKNQLLYVRGGDSGGIKLFDLHADEPAEKEVTSGRGFSISADGKQLVVMRGRTPAIGKAAASGAPKNVQTDGMNARIDPAHEWPQLFVDAWRLYRDYFYVENMHGVDWKAVREQYRPMIDACVSRSDVDFVLREMVAELNCGHTYVNGGPMERGPRVAVGMLGCDFALEQGAYRIVRILEGGVWDSDARGPLSQTGVDVHEGDWLLAVDGVPLDPAVDPWAAFVGRAESAVELTVSAEPTLDETARRVRVKTTGGEGDLRYRAWIEHNRAHAFEASGGRVGYIYVPDTGQRGRDDFFRQFYGQTHLAALIIDERWNGGGQFPNREIEALDRPRTNYWARRWGRTLPTPQDSHQGPKCMLINRDAGSGGDMFPYLFKQAGLGKLIGTRTWGGLVGYSGSPALIDGTTLAIPSFGFFELDGSWGVEGYGVAPDIEVLDDPALMQDGADPQLEAAIAEMLKELETKAYHAPERPAGPDRHEMTVPEADRNQFPSGGR